MRVRYGFTVFIRVVHRQGWDVELLQVERSSPAGPPLEKHNFPGREQALEFARARDPDWIEVGEVVYATPEVPQHHRWTTLRRQDDGTYRPSGLSWGGGR